MNPTPCNVSARSLMDYLTSPVCWYSFPTRTPCALELVEDLTAVLHTRFYIVCREHGTVEFMAINPVMRWAECLRCVQSVQRLWLKHVVKHGDRLILPARG